MNDRCGLRMMQRQQLRSILPPRGSILFSPPLTHRQCMRSFRSSTIAAQSSFHQVKKEGNISDSFASMSAAERQPLPDRFRLLKLSLAGQNERQIEASWKRLLDALLVENEVVARRGSELVPEVRLESLDGDVAKLRDKIQKRGVAIVRGVIPETEAKAYKASLDEYIQRNPQTKGFPVGNPQVFELYWSFAQLQARAHANLLRVQAALMRGLWNIKSPDSLIYLDQPLTYADRLRIRQPGDSKFALGPHQDGGSVERWELEGYGRSGTYASIFAGQWESYDPWDATGRLNAVTDLYNGLGACSMFRMFQGWLSMSNSGPQEGTLLVNPLLQLSTAYTLLRPFFRPLQSIELAGRDRFLAPDNWEFTSGSEMTSELQGATPGHGQELSLAMHPHLELDRTMIHIPNVRPGDFVVWHCDSIHAVDKIHCGTSDSSVLYVPVCPVTQRNASYVARQRDAFRSGTPAPDFPGGKGEAEHVDRPTETSIAPGKASRAMGLQKLEATDDMSAGGREVVYQANTILGFETS